mmetsp:Transcript_5840/g.14602  ORF Transcript_5840/g.14602 Transcript_5840/m.14602 type:complete len:397 (-) Transcript_5840:840-2030(-)
MSPGGNNMLRAFYFFIFVLLQASIYTFSNGCIFAVASDESSTCSEDASSCSEPDIHDQFQEESVSSPWAFMKAFSKLGTSWNHVIQEYKSVVKGADGVDLKGDVHAKDMDEGLVSLKSMVQEAASASKDDELSWSFHTTPLVDFGKTMDDVFAAFLRWSVVDKNSGDDTHSSCQMIGGVNNYDETQEINVSKAFRRLTSYTHWMQSVSSDLVSPPLTYASISHSLSTFSIQVTHDTCGRLVWWVNLGKTDMSAFKSQSPRETTRMFVWVAHLLFLDEGAQKNGLIVVDDISEIGFWSYMTMLPIEVGISVDRFLISVTPLKAKNVVLMHLPKWAEIGYGLLSWFLTAKMKSRVTTVSKGDEMETLEKVVGGSNFIPLDFGISEGSLKTDIIAQHRG